MSGDSVSSSQTITLETKSDGRKKIKYRYTFDDTLWRKNVNQLDWGPMIVPSGFDDATDRAGLVSQIEDGEHDRIADELERDAVEDGTDILTELLSLSNARQKKVMKQVVRTLLRLKNADRELAFIVIALESVINYIDSLVPGTYSKSQMATFLGITENQLDNMHEKADYILTTQSPCEPPKDSISSAGGIVEDPD